MREARAAAEKAQQLLQNVANRKRERQIERNGLVITKAVYGNGKALNKRDESSTANNEWDSQVIDVTVPLNFLVSDSGQLKVCVSVISILVCAFSIFSTLVVEVTYIYMCVHNFMLVAAS